MTPEEGRALQVGDRIKKVSPFFRGWTLLKVTVVGPHGVGLWCPPTGSRSFVNFEDLEQMVLVHRNTESNPAGQQRTVWDCLLEDD